MRDDMADVVEMTVTIPKSLWDMLSALVHYSKRDLNYIVRAALEEWLLNTAATGEHAVNPLMQAPHPPACPRCRNYVIYEQTKYAPLGFCLFCGEVTVDEDVIHDYHEQVKRYEELKQALR